MAQTENHINLNNLKIKGELNTHLLIHIFTKTCNMYIYIFKRKLPIFLKSVYIHLLYKEISIIFNKIYPNAY